MSTYTTACEVVCATHDRDPAALQEALRTLSRSQLRTLAVTLAAMVPPDSRTPAATAEAHARQLGLLGDGDAPGTPLVAEYVAEQFDLPVEEICGGGRRGFQARQVLCWVAHTCEGMSYSEIGRLVQRDHTTVMYAVEKVNRTPALRVRAALVAQRLGRTVAA